MDDKKKSYKSFKMKFSLKFFSLFFAVFSLLLASYASYNLTEAKIKVPYPNDVWLNKYPSIWLAISGDKHAIVNRKEWAENIKINIKKIDPNISVRTKFKPERSLEHLFLYPNLDELQEKKGALTTALINTSTNNLINSFDFFNSLSFFDKNIKKIDPVVFLDKSIESIEKEEDFDDENNLIKDFSYIKYEYDKLILKSKEDVNISFKVKNETDQIWQKEKYFLVPTKPFLHESIFYDRVSWEDKNKVVTFIESEVKPGEIATFTFKIKTDLNEGIYLPENFTLAYFNEENIPQILFGDDLFIEITIIPDKEELVKDFTKFNNNAPGIIEILEIEDKEELEKNSDL